MCREREVRGSWCGVCLGFVCARKWGFSGAFRGASVMMAVRCASVGRLLFRCLLRFEGKVRDERLQKEGYSTLHAPRPVMCDLDLLRGADPTSLAQWPHTWQRAYGMWIVVVAN